MAAPVLISVGRVSRPHGLHGELKIRIFSGSVDNLGPGVRLVLRIEGTERETRVTAVRPLKKQFLFRLEGVDSIEEAEKCRDAEILLGEEALGDPGPEGYYWYQVIGLPVVDEEGQELGRVADIIATPEYDVLICRSEDGEFSAPVVKEIVAGVDVAGGKIRLQKDHGLI